MPTTSPRPYLYKGPPVIIHVSMWGRGRFEHPDGRMCPVGFLMRALNPSAFATNMVKSTKEYDLPPYEWRELVYRLNDDDPRDITDPAKQADLIGLFAEVGIPLSFK